MPEVTTRLSNVSTLKAESVSISLSLHVCLWESLHQSRGDPPPSIRWAHIPTVCACALPLLTDRSNWQSRWRLQPCDPQTGLRTDTTQATDQRGWVWWGCKTAGVCVNVYGICFYACSKFWACSLPSKFHSCYRGQQSRGFFNSSSKLKLQCKA